MLFGNVAEITMLSIVLREIERGRPFGSLGRRSSGAGQAPGGFVQVHPRPCPGGRLFAHTGTVARRGPDFRIGRLLAAPSPAEKREEAIFEIVNQLNRGAASITSPDERGRQRAQLNLLAGQRAKATTAYASALTFLTAGAALLPENSWEGRQALTFALELHRAECEFLTGALAEAEQRLAALSARAGTVIVTVLPIRRRTASV